MWKYNRYLVCVCVCHPNKNEIFIDYFRKNTSISEIFFIKIPNRSKLLKILRRELEPPPPIRRAFTRCKMRKGIRAITDFNRLSIMRAIHIHTQIKRLARHSFSQKGKPSVECSVIRKVKRALILEHILVKFSENITENRSRFGVRCISVEIISVFSDWCVLYGFHRRQFHVSSAGVACGWKKISPLMLGSRLCPCVRKIF